MRHTYYLEISNTLDGKLSSEYVKINAFELKEQINNLVL